MGMTLMVYISVTKNIDLVTPNYYDKEIKYQEQINKINNTKSLKEQLKIQYSEGNLLFLFPSEGSPEGKISFYRPSDAKKDFQMPIRTNEEFKQHVETGRLQRGMWRVQVEWSMNGKEYFNEEKIMIQ
jgi:hypothetical protein